MTKVNSLETIVYFNEKIKQSEFISKDTKSFVRF